MHHIVVKTNLFLVGGIVRHLGGSDELKDLGGLYRSHPALAVVFLVPALSLAGIPPLSGFWAKLVLVMAGIEAEAWGITAVALGVSLLTLYSMTKLWNEAFWKPAPGDGPGAGAEAPASVPLTLLGPVLALAAVTVAVGLGAGPVFDLASQAAAQLSDPSQYIAAVLGPGGLR